MYLYRPIGRAVPSIVLAIVLAGLSTTPVIAQTVNASDADGDGIADTVDNCPNTANRAQRDTDDDGMGNACDNDIDNDDIANDQDNCPTRANPMQGDADDDGVGDACDVNSSLADSDTDGVPDLVDNCPATPNFRQQDADRDGIGDVCDPTPNQSNDQDFDGIDDATDNCPQRANNDQKDLDGDGLGDLCDPDDDGDGVPDGTDNCPNLANADQIDSDDDGIGDVCDFMPNMSNIETDTDGDGIVDTDDNCPFVANGDQLDADNDGRGNACDADDDNDGIADDGDSSGVEGDNNCSVGNNGACDDNCPRTPNAAQVDSDRDGIGDACDTGERLACGPNQPFKPLTMPDVALTSDLPTLCTPLTCGIDNESNVIDANPDNATGISLSLDLLGNLLNDPAQITLTDTNGAQFPPGTAVAVILSSRDALLSLDLLPSFTVSVLGNDQVVASSDDTDLLGLDLLGLANDENRSAVVFKPDAAFNAVRFSFAGTLNLLSSVDVFNVCVRQPLTAP